MASLLILRCVQSALKKSCDYRDGSEDTDWMEVKDNVNITAEDIRTVWFLISKEVMCLLISACEVCILVSKSRW